MSITNLLLKAELEASRKSEREKAGAAGAKRTRTKKVVQRLAKAVVVKGSQDHPPKGPEIPRKGLATPLTASAEDDLAAAMAEFPSERAPQTLEDWEQFLQESAREESNQGAEEEEIASQAKDAEVATSTYMVAETSLGSPNDGADVNEDLATISELLASKRKQNSALASPPPKKRRILAPSAIASLTESELSRPLEGQNVDTSVVRQIADPTLALDIDHFALITSQIENISPAAEQVNEEVATTQTEVAETERLERARAQAALDERSREILANSIEETMAAMAAKEKSRKKSTVSATMDERSPLIEANTASAAGTFNPYFDNATF